MLTAAEWAVFYQLLERIVNIDCPLSDKEEEVLKYAAINNCNPELQEFLCWDLSEEVI